MTFDHQKLAIIIVNWNTQDYLKKCLASIDQYYKNSKTEIWVIDNGSTDASADMVRQSYPQVRLLRNSENLGFARACNQGIQNSSTEYILLLNSDCELINNFIDPVLEVMERDKKIGVAGAILLHSNGKVQKAGEKLISLKRVIQEQLFFRSAPIFASTIDEMRKKHRSNVYSAVDFVSGACLFTRRSVINRIGLLRDDLFMYGEDMDFCRRTQEQGFRTVVFNDAYVIHHKGQSAKKDLETSLRYSILNNVSMLGELEGKIAAILALVFFFIGGWLRFFLAFFRPGIDPRAWLKLLLSYHRVVRAVLKKQHIKSFSS